MKAEERTKYALTMRLCYHCLSRGHQFKDCRIAKDRKCGVDNCLQSHHPLLHRPRGATFFSIEEYPDEEESFPEEEQTLISQQAFVNLTTSEAVHIPSHTPPKIMSKTVFKPDRSARVYNTIFSGVVYLCKGKFKRPVSIAYDGCSNNTNISAKLAEEMGLEVLTTPKDRVIDVLGGQSNVTSRLVKLELQPLNSNKAFEISGYTVTNFLDRVHVPDWADHLEKFEHLKHFKIPKLKHNRVDILLGTDFHKLLLANAKLSGKDEEPSAQMTDLGWMFGGPLENYLMKDVTNLAASQWVTHLCQDRRMDTESAVPVKQIESTFEASVNNTGTNFLKKQENCWSKTKLAVKKGVKLTSELGVICHPVKSTCYYSRLKKNKARLQRVADLPNFKQKERSKHFWGMGFHNSRPFSMEVGRRKSRRKVH